MGGRNWAVRSFLYCFIINGILVAFALGYKASGQIPTLFFLAVAGGLTVILWLLVLFAGRSSGRQVQQAPKEASPQPVSGGQASPEGAVQMLKVLQNEGRLIDFLQEDLSLCEDGQIGAAVRSIHGECKKALQEHMDLKPIFAEKEGATVTVPPGFDAKAIRLTGNVTGNPPFRGILRHRGWQADRIRLPQSGEQKNRWILALAEVEIE